MDIAVVKNVFNVLVKLNISSTKNVTILSGGRAVRWNSPVILMFFLVVFVTHLASQTSYSNTISTMLSTPSTIEWLDASHYARLFIYIFGNHGRWDGISYPLMMIVIVGPIIEERLGSIQLAFIVLSTAFITGLLHALLFRNSLYGPSCIAYMLIFLGSFVNVKKGEIPVSFILILIAVLFVGAEQWSQNFQHSFPMLMGSIMGSIMGMFWAKLARKVESSL